VSRSSAKIFVFVIFSMMLVALNRTVLACQVDDYYATREGYLAASTPEILNDAIKYQQVSNEGKIAELIGSGKVIKLKKDVKVRVLERSIQSKMLKIKLPDKEDLYWWVKDGSLQQINCN
jgi:hypothetical protein